ncbi:MAG: RNA polymerase sigma factor RpoH [Gammaproteobacteria bacterium]|nr:MAG: RNA polymerase sigma factor RpoH [Gammaproteobacteria bacterium]RTZ61304.1 MAG: RNA polymerase sigma factor RpoH [Gammaproteobacteria bacterium]
MSNTIALTANLSENSLSSYIQAASKAPMLSADKEHELALKLRDENDLDAARQLVESHLRYVIKITRDFVGYGLPQADLIQEGNIGLMKAVKNFDPDRGVRLVAFAVHWIRAEIYEFVIRNWRTVKVATTKAQRKLFFNLRKSKSHLGWMTNGEVDALADRLNVSKKDVLEMESRLSGKDVAFDVGDDADDNRASYSPSAWLTRESDDPANLVMQSDSDDDQHGQITQALATLDDRSRDIVARRWLGEDKPTLHDLADEYGVSAERIRQIEKKALENMKGVIAL